MSRTRGRVAPAVPKTMDDIDLVTLAYDRCWQRSRGRYNSWIDGRLDPLARRFYIVVNATERCLMGGPPSLLEDPGFSLAETADAFASFGFAAHAHVVRELNALVDDRLLSRDRRQRSAQLNDITIPPADIDRLNRLFPKDEDRVWRLLADVIRRHPDAFPAAHDAAQGDGPGPRAAAEESPS